LQLEGENTMIKMTWIAARVLLAASVAGGLWTAGRWLSPPAEARLGQPVRADMGGSRSTRPTIVGQARVLDGDTIEIAHRRIRLEGIDAPEIGQRCRRPWLGRISTRWDCGADAKRRLEGLVEGRAVACDSVGSDAYARILGICRVAGQDLNALLVREGLAWAFRKYSERYVAEEERAKSERLGIWQQANTPAWEYRAGRWGSVAQTAPNGCAIKGNIGRGGRIYHMPWSPWYDKVRVDTEKGERWFCDEREAVAAGFRLAGAR
jgi:endonuclease YncB( thermonuclease family)